MIVCVCVCVYAYIVHVNTEKEVATNFLRTISSQGSRPLDPAAKAAVHKTRVRSAVMTPARKTREEQKMVQNEYRKLSRY